jgi:hypothetical protein
MRFALVAGVLHACLAMEAKATTKEQSLARLNKDLHGESEHVPGQEEGEKEDAVPSDTGDAVPSDTSFVQDGSGLGVATNAIHGVDGDWGSDNSEDTTNVIRDYTLAKPAMDRLDPFDSTCTQKMDSCFAECESMFWYFIDIVTQKFHGLEFLPLQHLSNPEEVLEKATLPVLNEGAYLFCGWQNCLETNCQSVCASSEQYSQDDLSEPKNPSDKVGEQCQSVEVKKRKYIQQWLSSAHIKPTIPYMTVPACRSVCGPKEPAMFSEASEVELWSNNDVVEMKGGSVVSTRLELFLFAVLWTGVNFR